MSQLSAQDCSLNLAGQVYDGSEDHPLAFAEIFIEELGQGTVTATEGQFAFSDLCPGEYHLRITHLGCHPERIYINLQTDITDLAVALAHHAELLEQIEVTDTRSGDVAQSRQSLGREALEQGAGQNLGQLMEGLAGLSLVRNGNGIAKPVIHGLTGNRIAILNNGIPQAGQQWGVDHAPEIDPFTADRLTLIKGVDGLAYGSNTLGGAVLVEPGNIKKDPHLHGAAQYVYGSNGRQHTLSSRIEKSGRWADWRLVGTFRQGGDQRTPDYWLRNTGLRERNLAALLQQQTNTQWYNELYYSFFYTEIGILRGAHIGNTTDLETAIGREVPFFTEPDFTYRLEEPRQRVQHHLLKYRSQYTIDANQYLQMTYAGQLNDRQEFDVRRGNRSDRPALDLQLWSHQLTTSWHRSRGIQEGQLGFQMRFVDNGNQRGTGVLPLIPNYTNINPALFYLHKWKGEHSRWQLGARYDYVRLRIRKVSNDLPRRFLTFKHAFHNYSVAAGWHYSPAPHWTSKVNVGTVRRSPEVNELYSQGLHQGVAAIEEGDADLQPEQSYKAIWTNNFHWEDRLVVEASAYYQLIEDYIFLEPQAENRLTIRGAFPLFLYRQTNARLAGLDLTTNIELDEHLSSRISYAMVRGYDRSNRQPLVYIPADNLRADLTWTMPGALEDWSLTASGSYTWQQSRLLPEQDFLPPPTGYFLLDGQLNTEWLIGNNTLHASLQVQNALNTRYRDYLNRLRYFADETGRNVRVNLRWEF